MRIFVVVALSFVTSACSQSAWEVKDEADAMSDLRTLTAVTTVEGQFANYEAVVRCIPQRKSLSYMVSAFDNDGNGVPLSRSIGASEFRPDGEPSRLLPAVGLNGVAAYANTVNAARASKILIRIGTLAGSDTFELDQSGADFRSVVEPCLRILAESKRKSDEEEASRKAAEQEMQDVSTQNDSLDGAQLDDQESERPIRMDEIQEIEQRTGRPYQDGDSIYDDQGDEG